MEKPPEQATLPEQVAQPLAQSMTAWEHTTADEQSRDLVDFEPSPDPENPQDWSEAYRWSMTLVLATMTLIVNWTTLMCAPAVPQILSHFNAQDSAYSTLIVTMFDLGEVFGPLLLAPCSELYGRLPVYNTTNVLYVLWSMAGGFSKSLSMLVAFRFLNGTAVSSATLNSAIVGDLFRVESRGRAMSVLSLPPLLGPALGPVIGSYLASSQGWRWTFWLAAVVCGGFEVAFFFLYRETYKVRILHVKARRLRRETGNEALRSVYHEEKKPSRIVYEAIVRPLQMPFVSPVVFILGVYSALVYGYVYLILTTVTEIFESRYGFSTSSVGLVSLGIGIGMAIGVLFCALTIDHWVKKQRARGNHEPEARLPPMVLGGLVIPIGLFVYGWTAEANVHWIVPILSTGVVGFGLMSTRIPALSYIVDIFGIHAASAVAGLNVLSYVTGAFLPLIGPPLYDRLGLGWGNSVLGFIATAFLPVPLLLMKYGKRLRQRSKFEPHF